MQDKHSPQGVEDSDPWSEVIKGTREYQETIQSLSRQIRSLRRELFRIQRSQLLAQLHQTLLHTNVVNCLNSLSPQDSERVQNALIEIFEILLRNRAIEY